jgi:mRNA interferase HicA
MKRNQLLKHLKKQGCYLFREGKKHSVFVNSKNNRASVVPRHSEIDDYLANKVCKDLGIEPIK